MRTLHQEQHARAIHDPLGLTSQTSKQTIKSSGSEAASEVHTDDREISSVNPLWMITAGLAAFVVLLVVVW